MAECPAGQDLRIALGNMQCRGCVVQCMISDLQRKIEDLESKISKQNK